MESLKRWLVALDLTDHDQSILQYSKLLSKALHPEHIEFVFIAHKLSDHIRAHIPDIVYPAYDQLFDKITKSVHEHFTGEDPVSCEILDGTVKFDLWRESFVKDIDLFIAGSKPRHKDAGLIPHKFVRRSFCSVLLVPYQSPKTINKIWVPMDFSKASGAALMHAFHISQVLDPPAEVVAHHVYQLPHAYYYQGFPRDEIMQAVRLEAEDQCQQFLKEFNPENRAISTCFTEIKQSYAANSIKVEAENQGADLILMSAGGRSRFSKLLLGSETDKLVQIEKQVPLFILKKKADHVRLWDLFSINN